MTKIIDIATKLLVTSFQRLSPDTDFHFLDFGDADFHCLYFDDTDFQSLCFLHT